MLAFYQQSDEYAPSLLESNRARWAAILSETLKFITDKTGTIAALRLLYTLHRCLEDNGYQSVNRQALASALGRPAGLTPWDRKLLKRLEAAKLIKCERVTLPGRVVAGVLTGRGYEYRYLMSVKLGYRLYALKQLQASNIDDIKIPKQNVMGSSPITRSE